MKKTYHYHICSGCGRWKHEGKACNLSNHSACGFKYANDLTTCMHGKKLELTQAEPAELLSRFLRRRVNNKINDKQFFSAAFSFQVDENTAIELLYQAYAKKNFKEIKTNKVRAVREAKAS